MFKNLNWYMYLALFLLLEWLFPIFLYFALQTLPILWLMTFSIWVSILFGFIVFFKEKLYNQYKKKEILIPTFFSALFLWMWALLYFFWIKYSSPSIASMLLLLQSFFAFIIFNIFWEEKYNLKQIIWAILMFIWWIIVLYDGSSFINIWVIIMFIAWIVYTIWNYYTKKATSKWANPFFLLINRNFLMVFVTIILAIIFVWPIDLELIKQNFIWVFLIWFLVLFLSKASWIIALTKLNSFVAISSFPMIPLLVILFSFIILKEIPTTKEILWFAPILIGTLLLINKK